MQEYLNQILPTVETLQKKNTDYGNSYELLRERFGEVAFIVRLFDKVYRLEALYNNGEAKVTDESFEDTIKDIVGYCTLELKYRSERRE